MFALLLRRKKNNDVKAILTANSFNERMSTVQGAQMFNGTAQYITLNEYNALLVVDIKVLFPPVHYVFGLGSLVALFFSAYIPFAIVGGLFFLLAYVRSKYFFMLLMKKGLRKKGYDDKVGFL